MFPDKMAIHCMLCDFGFQVVNVQVKTTAMFNV